MVISATWALRRISSGMNVVAAFFIDESKLCVVDYLSVSTTPDPVLRDQASAVVKLGLMSPPDCTDC
jgi:hypothetical protein